VKHRPAGRAWPQTGKARKRLAQCFDFLTGHSERRGRQFSAVSP
jgi:hypothetical protein